MNDLEFQKLRSEGNKLLSDAQSVYGKGDTDLAMSMLQDFQTRVRSSSLSASKQALLLRPIDSRLETFAVMKRTMDKRDKAGLVAAAEEMKTTRSKEIMDEFREVVAAALAREEVLIVERDNAATARYNTAIFTNGTFNASNGAVLNLTHPAMLQYLDNAQKEPAREASLKATQTALTPEQSAMAQGLSREIEAAPDDHTVCIFLYGLQLYFPILCFLVPPYEQNAIVRIGQICID